MPILGFDFELGPAVPPPGRARPTRNTLDEDRWRREWQSAIEQAVRDEDAWALMCTATDCDVTLRDVLTDGAAWQATRAFSVHLLLARESRPPGGGA